MGNLLSQLAAALKNFVNDQGEPLLKNTQPADLLQIYRKLLAQPERPARSLRVVSAAGLAPGE